MQQPEISIHPLIGRLQSIGSGYPDAHFVQLGQIENGVNEGAVHWNAKTAFSFTPSLILT